METSNLVLIEYAEAKTQMQLLPWKLMQMGVVQRNEMHQFTSSS